jgi:hypothetical protein
MGVNEKVTSSESIDQISNQLSIKMSPLCCIKSTSNRINVRDKFSN